MSRGNDLRQHSLQRQAQHQRQFDASSRHMRQSAQSAHHGFQTRIRSQADQTARMRQARFQLDRAARQRQQFQTNTWHQQYHQAWPMDSGYASYEPVKRRGAGRIVVGTIRFMLFLGWLAGMGWLVWAGVNPWS